MALFAFGDPNAEVLLNGHRDLQRVERVKAEALSKERRVLVNVFGRPPLQVELGNEDVLDFLYKRGAHVGPGSSGSIVRRDELAQGEGANSVGSPSEVLSLNILVSYVAEGGVATLTLNDPPVNAFTHEMMKELDEAILEARFDNDVHSLVITGHGDRAFSAGTNQNMLREVDPTFKYYFALHTAETLRRLESTPKLVVAAINGHCLAGGLELALACDVRLARRGDFSIGRPEVLDDSQRLLRAIGRAEATALLLEGASLSVDRALAIGLVHQIIDARSGSDFLKEAADYARRICTQHRSPSAIGRLKRSLLGAHGAGLDEMPHHDPEQLRRLGYDEGDD